MPSSEEPEKFGNPPPYPGAGGFAALFDRHLRFGTRPARPGKRWGNKEFAYAVGDVNERTVRNWRTSRSRPADIASIERALFGDNETYRGRLFDLRRAYDEPAPPAMGRAAPRRPSCNAVGTGSKDGTLIRPWGGQHRSSASVAGEPQRLVHFMIGDLTGHFVERPKEYDDAKKAILSAGRTVALTTALHGAGGYGKTTLANALCRDPAIQSGFPDGVLRVELGKEISDVTSRILNLIALIDPNRQLPGITDASIAADLLAGAVGDARILLVLDDVWREPQLRPFLRGGPNCVRLVTTRIPEVLPAEHVAVRIDEMTADQALAVLGEGLPGKDDLAVRHHLARLADRLGFWGQMLAVANGWLLARTRKDATTAGALTEFESRLTRRRLTSFDPRNETQRHRAIGLCVEASLEELDPDSERVRVDELAVLPEDTDVPISVVTALWAASAGMDADDVDDLLQRLDGLSLLQGLRRDTGTVRLHVGSSRVDLQACKLEYSIVSPK